MKALQKDPIQPRANERIFDTHLSEARSVTFATPARSRMAHDEMQNLHLLAQTTSLGAIQHSNHDQSSIDLRYGFLQMQIAGIELSDLHQALPIPDVKFAPLKIY